MAAKQLDALTKELTVPMGKWLKGFPQVMTLHPFEVALLELTLGDDRYDKTLRRVDALRKRLLETGKGFAAKGEHSPLSPAGVPWRVAHRTHVLAHCS
jgi:nucleolar GTP-binding protein